MKRGRSTLAGALLLALAAGCGGGAEAIAKDDYLERAQTICRDGNQELATATREAFKDLKQGQKPTPDQLERYAREVVVPMVRQQVRDLRALPDPEGGADQVDEIYDAFERVLDRIDEHPTLLTDNPDVFGLFKEADDLSKKYGFPVCT